ncbi:hypothetical protein CTM97_19315 [Photobacterium phosphoreum]|uniref:Uncharacterized protein n=1 Tax=Photobacterium phosphoreum TaxID=659 RepID=A0A2T3JQ17_PHOPO|nr:hypothetical protein CTM96_12130 [Photobacterium phosphoreum]PSU38241.1 hypothetical protein CTM97_19315 [Photobacterium phosphoreum]PSU51145.1 hypothetical protein C9J18_13200 [Photobacterium phosphoreum]
MMVLKLKKFNELAFYYNTLLTDAASLANQRKLLLYCVLVCLIASLYLTKVSLYGTSAIALILQIITMFMDQKIKAKRSLAVEIQKHSMLMDFFGAKAANQPEIERLKIKAGLSIYNQAKVKRELFEKEKNEKPIKEEGKSSNLKENQKYDDKPNKKLLSKIHENSYWNNNLYNFSYQASINLVAIVIFLIFIVLVTVIPNIKLDTDYTIIRLIFTVMSFGIIYEFIEATLKYQNSSKVMKDLDQKISSVSEINEQEILSIFSTYLLIISTTPHIPKAIYIKYQDLLNAGWASRLKVINESSTLSVNDYEGV